MNVMGITSLYDYTKLFTELQSQCDSISEYPKDVLNIYLDNLSRHMLNPDDILHISNIDLSRLNTIPFSANIPQSSLYVAHDEEDIINEECVSVSDNVSSSRIVKRTSKDSTSSADMNRINEEFRVSLFKRTQTFIWTLKHTDFEDGIENDIIKEIEGYIKMNKFVTYLWLHSIYAKNQKDTDILAGLLRIIGMTVEKEDIDMLLTMVKAGLSDSQSKTQEAALMVIEQWRTQNCLTALETAPNFSSSWISDYAEQIKLELKKELLIC